MNRELRRHKLLSPKAATVLTGSAGIALLLGLAVFAVTVQRGLPLVSYYNINARFANAGNLTRYSDVRVAGKRVGQVLGVSYVGGATDVRMQLSPGTTPLPADTTARIRLKGLIGAKFVELDPGHSRAHLTNGATIPLSRTSSSVNLFDILPALDSQRRAELRASVQGLGEGLLGRGPELNHTLHELPPVLLQASDIAEQVNADPAATRELVPALDSAAVGFDAARRDLTAGFAPTAAALAPFIERRTNTDQALGLAPSTLATVRQGLASTDPLLRQAAGFARASIRLTRPLPASLEATTALLRRSPGALISARKLLELLRPAIPPTIRLTSTLEPLIAPTGTLLSNPLSALSQLSHYGCDVAGFARNWRSMLGFGTAGSGGPVGPVNILRVTLGVTPDLIGDTPAKPATLVGRDPYPAPCTASQEYVK